MTLLPQEKHANIMEAFRMLIGRLHRCIRWEGYDYSYKQSSLDHSFSLGILTAYCVRREAELGGVKLDAARLIVHALVHDFSEGVIGDVTYRFKNDPRLKILYKRIEQAEGLDQMERFGPMTAFLRDVYDLTDDSIEALFFDALEKLDYFLYAVSEYLLHKHVGFVAVFGRQHEKLVEYTQRFRVINELYPLEIQTWVSQEIEKNSAHVEKRQVVKAQESHLDDMLDALRSLINTIDTDRKALIEKVIKTLQP